MALSASTVKAWFQYRCERKVRYELFNETELATIPIPKDVREKRGVNDALLRLSVGIESQSDIIADVEEALLSTRTLAVT